MNKASCSILVLLMTVSVAIGQHTVRIELSKLPANHPPGSSIYIAGSFNKWNPGDANFIFHQQASGSYAIDLQLAPGEYEFKFTRGDWSKVECNTDGSIAGNHSIKISDDTSIR